MIISGAAGFSVRHNETKTREVMDADAPRETECIVREKGTISARKTTEFE